MYIFIVFSHISFIGVVFGMPYGFIFIIILCFALFYYKKFMPLNLNKVVFVFCLLVMLLGYAIGTIDINNEFNINVIFSFIILVLCVNIILKTKARYVVVTMFLATFVGVGYYFLSMYNSDVYTFFNYFYMLLIIAVLSVIFVANINAGVGFILLSFVGIEVVNYFHTQGLWGYLSLFSYTMVNYLAIALTFYVLLHLVYKNTFKGLYKYKRRQKNEK